MTEETKSINDLKKKIKDLEEKKEKDKERKELEEKLRYLEYDSLNKGENKKGNRKEMEMWVKLIVIPLMVGLVLVSAKTSIAIFGIVGLGLVAFGLLAVIFCFVKHKEKLRKMRNDLINTFRRKKK